MIGLLIVYRQLRDDLQANTHIHRSSSDGKNSLFYSDEENSSLNGTGKVSVSVEKKSLYHSLSIIHRAVKYFAQKETQITWRRLFYISIVFH